MIDYFVEISFTNENLGKVKFISKGYRSFSLGYPCSDPHVCAPYRLKLNTGVYKMECWGSIGECWSSSSTPGLGGYTSGYIFIQNPIDMYVFVGNTGFFNAVKEMEKETIGLSPGGATDVRLNISDKWWDPESLISRIMVAAGGGGAEWQLSIGGNGGGLNGTQSISAKSSTAIYDDPCPGATQRSGSKCSSLEYSNPSILPASEGSFGSAGQTEPIQNKNGDDYGAFGGGGYYGGTSYQLIGSGSGGSSFISGYPGCDAVKNQINPIIHTGQPIHYSGLVFINPVMITGNSTMPLPENNKENVHKGTGAFRLTLVYCDVRDSCKKSLDFRFLRYSFIFIFDS